MTVKNLSAPIVEFANISSDAYASANTPDTLVLRDSSGSFSATNINLFSVTIPNIGVITGATYTSSSITVDQLVDSFDITLYRTAKYTVQIESGANYHSSELLVTHDGTEPFWTRYAEIASAGQLADVKFDINGLNLRLLVSPVFAVTKFKLLRQTVSI
jgi:hypothetical protein